MYTVSQKKDSQHFSCNQGKCWPIVVTIFLHLILLVTSIFQPSETGKMVLALCHLMLYVTDIKHSDIIIESQVNLSFTKW